MGGAVARTGGGGGRSGRDAGGEETVSATGAEPSGGPCAAAGARSGHPSGGELLLRLRLINHAFNGSWGLRNSVEFVVVRCSYFSMYNYCVCICVCMCVCLCAR
jgi:hypothetical protein